MDTWIVPLLGEEGTAGGASPGNSGGAPDCSWPLSSWGEGADSQEQECPGPLGHVGQATANQESQEVHQDPHGDHKEDSVETQDVQQLEMVDAQLS